MAMEITNTGAEELQPKAVEAAIQKQLDTLQNSDPLTYVVEDDKANNFLCKMTLDEVGITNVSAFLRAELALADLNNLLEAKQEFPSLILLDINMPAMDGWAFLNEFRNFPEAARLKTSIYLFSTSDHPNDIAKKDLYPEVLDFVAKPLSEEVAITLKEKYLRPRIAA